MIKVDYLILGAGISGLAAGQKLKEEGKEYLILEKNSSYGGLCDNFEIDGFRFDKFVHLSFTKDKKVRKFFDQTDYYTHTPNPYNYYKGIWLKHPAQNNLYPLSKKEKQLVLEGLYKRDEYKYGYESNYERWLRYQFGDYFAENFAMKYTKKYWGIEAKNLETKWIGYRIYQPSINEILEGMSTSETPITYYAKEMRYPKIGGFKTFLSSFVNEVNIQYNAEVIKIDSDKKLVYTQNNAYQYKYLISSLPLPEYQKYMNLDEKVSSALNHLCWTSGYIISIGFNNQLNRNDLWDYIYDEDILPARIYSPSLKSSDNAPRGCSSIQAEIYFKNDKILKKDRKVLLEETIDKLNKAKIISKDNILVKDIRFEKYVNVLFNHKIYESKKIVHDYLNSKEVITIGRFGEWDYLWSDQSFLSGYLSVNKFSE